MFKRKSSTCFACNSPSHSFNYCLDVEKKAKFANSHPEKICRYYAKNGDCWKGPDCRFLHFISTRSTIPNEGVSAERNDVNLVNQQTKKRKNENGGKSSDGSNNSNATSQNPSQVFVLNFDFLVIHPSKIS